MALHIHTLCPGLAAALLQVLYLPSVEAASRAGSSTAAAAAAAGGEAAGAAAGSSSRYESWAEALRDAAWDLVFVGVRLSVVVLSVPDYASGSQQAMSLLGSADALELMLLASSQTARQLHHLCKGRSTIPDSSSINAVTSSSSSSSRPSGKLLVPPYHLQLLQALHPSLVRLLPEQQSENISDTARQPQFQVQTLTSRATCLLKALRCLLLGPAMVPCPCWPFGEAHENTHELWPPVVQVPQHLLLPLLQVVVELVVLDPTSNKKVALELLRELQPNLAAAADAGGQDADAAADQAVLAGLVEPYLHVLGPAVLHADDLKQQQQESLHGLAPPAVLGSFSFLLLGLLASPGESLVLKCALNARCRGGRMLVVGQLVTQDSV